VPTLPLMNAQLAAHELHLFIRHSHAAPPHLNSRDRLGYLGLGFRVYPPLTAGTASAVRRCMSRPPAPASQLWKRCWQGGQTSTPGTTTRAPPCTWRAATACTPSPARCSLTALIQTRRTRAARQRCTWRRRTTTLQLSQRSCGSGQMLVY
jgi:hypothetical protein